MPIKKKTDYVPIKCEGWDGKFVFAPGTTNNVSKVMRYNQNITNWNDFYGYCAEPPSPKVVWDGTFAKKRNRSDDSKFFAYNTEPEVLPPTWDGTFAKSGETYLKQERNQSDDSKYFSYNTEPEILPPTWDGSFKKSGETFIIPERNFSDARDYAEAKNFRS
uniref:Uncharacterized protein n=1 Tax=Megaselia scalaris TaxID=36166 RepID=T1GGK4_MEGSC